MKRLILTITFLFALTTTVFAGEIPISKTPPPPPPPGGEFITTEQPLNLAAIEDNQQDNIFNAVKHYLDAIFDLVSR